MTRTASYKSSLGVPAREAASIVAMASLYSWLEIVTTGFLLRGDEAENPSQKKILSLFVDPQIPNKSNTAMRNTKFFILSSFYDWFSRVNNQWIHCFFCYCR
mmetsp:Transcript_5540/g.13189  ORF Transcript_5540/g.13189 Transcript_5540/m.13189 type:complete len:102 (+) Transcript_5540:2229-2534(+)